MLATTKRRARKLLAIILTPVLPIMGKRALNLTTRMVNPKHKLYIPFPLGVEGFFAALEKQGADHVVLRWFEELPHIEAGHDLDILVADDAVNRVRGFLSTWPLGQKIDMYSETGLNRTGYQPEKLRNVPAFPSDIARTLLDGAIMRPGGWAVPSPVEHFLGLAYHAVYLKGHDSGLPADKALPALKAGSRDYAEVLTNLAGDIGREIEHPVTMKSLDNMLAEEGWKPGKEHLAALADVNPWIDLQC